MAQPAIPNPVKTSSIETGLTPKTAPAPKKKPQQKQVSSTQIIQQSVAKEQPGADVNRIMQTLAYMMQRKMIQLIQIGNTVFLLQPKEPGMSSSIPSRSSRRRIWCCATRLASTR